MKKTIFIFLLVLAFSQVDGYCNQGASLKGQVNIYDSDVADNVRIQYGGSVKPENIKELMEQEDIDGGLIGGAALEAESFSKIVKY